MKLHVRKCYATAWESFQKGWIPICAVSSLIVLLNILPRVLAWSEISSLREQGASLHKAVIGMDASKIGKEFESVTKRLTSYMAAKLWRVFPYMMPFTALLTIILLLYANRAIKHNMSTRLPLRQILFTAFINLLMILTKTLALFLFVIPGVYLYVKLYFIPLVMLDDGVGPVVALRKSWRMTRGSFWQILTVVTINGIVQILAIPSVIGAIPATGYANTVRAAAYRNLVDRDKNPVD